MSDKVLQAITSELGDNILISKEDIEERYAHIWKMDSRLQAKAVALPRSTYDVSIISKICCEHRQSIVIHGGLTGLVGSTNSNSNELVISLEKLNHIIEIDQSSRTMTVEAGVILEDILIEADKNSLFFPMNFGAKGSAQIGGCLATNAGGLRVVRYGMIRNMVLGLEVVLPNGQIINSLKKLLKDNSGYGLDQLFIGSEGTLGIITKAVLRLQEKPLSRNSAFISFDNFETVIKFLKFSDAKLGGQLSGFEIIWGDTYKILTSIPSLHKPVLPHGNQFYILLETMGGNPDADRNLLESILELAIKDQMVTDAMLAYTSKDLMNFWNIREDVALFNDLSPFQQHFDISLPTNAIGSFVETVKSRLLRQTGVHLVHTFGHLADGNIHFVVGKNTDSSKLRDNINDIVYSPIKQLNGSVSAEHGIGLDKKKWLPLSRSEEETELMKTIKRAFDPHSILNRGRIFDL